MKKLSLTLVLVLLVTSLFGMTAASAEWKPEKPITIMNYVKAGGGMDVTTRKFQEVASKYTDATLIVDNKPGAGGITAADYILSQEADGYTIFGTTVSYVDKVVSDPEKFDVNKYLWGFEWIANIVGDPYCIMVAKDSPFNTLEDLIADAKANKQNWMGPSLGGAKHLVALQYWDAMGVYENFIPFESGPDALLAVMGGQGVATVGNPSDVNGRDLKHLVIGNPERLAAYPDVPTWTELGYPELDKIAMWRGYAVKKGTPAEAIAWWQDLCEKVKNDPDWIEYNTNKSYVVQNIGIEEFTAQVKKDAMEHFEILKADGMVDEDVELKLD